MNKMGRIHHDDGRWFVSFEGKPLMSAKGELYWAKSNARRNRKIQDLGLRKFEVIVDGKVDHIFDMDGKGRSTKIKVSKPKEVKIESMKVDSIPKTKKVKRVEEVTESLEERSIKVVGHKFKGSMMEGYSRKGILVGKAGRIITLEFASKRDGGVNIQYEFDAKTGIQRTDNPYHVWKIENVAAV